MTIQEISFGPRPTINDDALRVFDQKNKKIYVYGGSRWIHNPDSHSPTLRPTSDFFWLDMSNPNLYKWINYSGSMREDPAKLSPFKKSPNLSSNDESKIALPRLGSLPVLQDPIGTLFYDKSRSRTTYLLIFGDPIAPGLEDHPILICINLTLNLWSEIALLNSRKLKDGRAAAQMIVTGEIGMPNIYLSIFGGIDDKVEEAFSLDTFSVADLSQGKWIAREKKIPSAVGPLGSFPALSNVGFSDSTPGKILILKGRPEQTDAAVDFQESFLFTPSTLKFEIVLRENLSSVPPPAEFYTLQQFQKPSHGSCSSFWCISWDIHDVCDNNNVVFKATHNLRIWEAHLREPEAEESIEQEGESLACEEDRVTTSRIVRVASASASNSILAQKAKRSVPLSVGHSILRLKWKDITSQRMNSKLQRLDTLLRVEVVCVLVKPPFESTESSGHRLVIVGYSPEFAGEIKGGIYNASAVIRLPANEDETDSESSDGSQASAISGEQGTANSDQQDGETNESVAGTFSPFDSAPVRESDPNVDPTLLDFYHAEASPLQIQAYNLTAIGDELGNLNDLLDNPQSIEAFLEEPPEVMQSLVHGDEMDNSGVF
ncbi:hypothetical protein DFH11DRAFT_1586395 [Phellopilus nigrolimitatus]|nr:hypothetical protein DFH11DRAFT_1586395 [Phellopilus nigrolimitatus]